MSTYEITSSVIALLAIVISFIALIRTRELAKKQFELEKTQTTLDALSALVTGYTEQANLFERALKDGTVDIHNLNRDNMEFIVDEYYTKRHDAIEKIEELLESCNRTKK